MHCRAAEAHVQLGLVVRRTFVRRDMGGRADRDPRETHLRTQDLRVRFNYLFNSAPIAARY